VEKKSNFELMRHFVDDVWVNGNEDTIFEEFEGVSTGLWPDEEGVDPYGFLQYYRSLSPLINDLSFEYKNWNEFGDRVWVSWYVCGKHWKDSERLIRWPGAACARYRDGKMVECDNFQDFMTLFSQLNLTPEQAIEHGLAGVELLESEERRKEALAPSAKGQSHFLWPGLKKVVTNGHEIYLPASASQLSPETLPATPLPLPNDEQLEVLFESTAFSMVIVDEQDVILKTDDSFSELVDRLPESLPGTIFHHFIMPDDQAREQALFTELIEGKTDHYRLRVRIVRGRTILGAQLSVARTPSAGGGARIVRAIQESSRIEEVVEYQETERKILALDLHDGLAQDIAGLWLYMQTGRNQVEPAPVLIERCLGIVERMNTELRNQMLDLRSPILEGASLPVALERLSSRLARETALQISLVLAAELEQTDHTVSLLAFRVVQEALRNVVAHSGAKNCWVSLKKENDKLTGSIKDDGKGFDIQAASARGRLGIRGMKDRCQLIGGHLSITSNPNSGTEISFEVPWSPRLRKT